ncbi:MAG TPA: coenzyme F420-0:L-glutamate ligase [Candidatus Saccharimonadales bacterium]|nr:coenzyme F420-0:L-glutamate ligase [Candidatus Saccharimonadales bacterium]
MKLHALKTAKVLAGQTNITELLDAALPELQEGGILAVSSKIVALCENSVRPISSVSKQTLVEEEAERYLPSGSNSYGFSFTIIQRTLIPMAGIDESNGNGNYVLWPRDAQASANQIRHYLVERFKLQKVGVIITDSTCQPLRRGTSGIAVAHSGFKALRNYIGQGDLFGRPFGVSQASIAGGLAAAAVLAMGEGTEQTPLCIISDLPPVEFQPRDPSAEELDELYVTADEDIFGPFLQSVDWREGKRK